MHVINSKMVICYLNHLKASYIILPLYLLILQFLRIKVFSTVNNVITTCGARRVLDLLGGPFCKLQSVKPLGRVPETSTAVNCRQTQLFLKKKRIFS